MNFYRLLVILIVPILKRWKKKRFNTWMSFFSMTHCYNQFWHHFLCLFLPLLVLHFLLFINCYLSAQLISFSLSICKPVRTNRWVWPGCCNYMWAFLDGCESNRISQEWVSLLLYVLSCEQRFSAWLWLAWTIAGFQWHSFAEIPVTSVILAHISREGV